MITKQTAQKALAAIRVGNEASQKIFASLEKNKNGLKASVYQVRAAEVKELKLLANNVCKVLTSSFKSVDDINRAMKIEAVNRLLADAAQMKLTAEILDEVLEENDEFAQLPDEEKDVEILESEDEDQMDGLPDEDETLESEDDGEDGMDEDDGETLESTDEIDVENPHEAGDAIMEEVMESKKQKQKLKNLRDKSAKVVKASSNEFGFKWNFGNSGK